MKSLTGNEMKSLVSNRILINLKCRENHNKGIYMGKEQKRKEEKNKIIQI